MPVQKNQFIPYFNRLKQLASQMGSDADWARENALLRRLAAKANTEELEAELSQLFNGLADETQRQNKAEAWKCLRELLGLVALQDSELRKALAEIDAMGDAEKKKNLAALFRNERTAQYYAAQLKEFWKKPPTTEENMKQVFQTGMDEYLDQFHKARQNAAYDPWDRVFFRIFSLISQMQKALLLKMGLPVNPGGQSGAEDDSDQLFGPDGKRIVRPKGFNLF